MDTIEVLAEEEHPKALPDLSARMIGLNETILRSTGTSPAFRLGAIDHFKQKVLAAEGMAEARVNEAFRATLMFKYSFHNLNKLADGFKVFQAFQEMLTDLGVEVEREVVLALSGAQLDTKNMTAEEVINYYIGNLSSSLKKGSWRSLPDAWRGSLLMQRDLHALDAEQFQDSTLLKLYRLTGQPQYVRSIQGDLVSDPLIYDLGL